MTGLCAGRENRGEKSVFRGGNYCARRGTFEIKLLNLELLIENTYFLVEYLLLLTGFQRILKNYESELFVIFVLFMHSIFNVCLKELSSPHCRKVSSVVPVLKNVRKRSECKEDSFGLRLDLVVSKIFEKLVNTLLHQI